MRMNTKSFMFLVMTIAVLAYVPVTHAWTAATSTAPGGNVSPPINIGTTNQVKNGSIGVGGLAVFGNTLLQGNSYLNFGATAGLGGYGLRDNAGIVEVKNQGGTWQSLRNAVLALVSGTEYWETGPGNSLHYAGGAVGIGTAAPVATLDINGYARLTPQTSAPFACDASRKGTIAVATYLSKICLCNGSEWRFNYSGGTCAWVGTSGSQVYAAPGTYTFIVPAYAGSLSVQVWGAGGGASGGDYFHNYSKGGDGGTSSFVGLSATGGVGGVAASHQGPWWVIYVPATGGAGGVGSGGSTNLNGSAGQGDEGAGGGASPNGGAASSGGAAGNAPGGGGSGTGGAGGGGGGGYTAYTYAPGALPLGNGITVTVGGGGAGASAGCCTGGSGAPGRVVITWN